MADIEKKNIIHLIIAGAATAFLFLAWGSLFSVFISFPLFFSGFRFGYKTLRISILVSFLVVFLIQGYIAAAGLVVLICVPVYFSVYYLTKMHILDNGEEIWFPLSKLLEKGVLVAGLITILLCTSMDLKEVFLELTRLLNEAGDTALNPEDERVKKIIYYLPSFFCLGWLGGLFFNGFLSAFLLKKMKLAQRSDFDFKNLTISLWVVSGWCVLFAARFLVGETSLKIVDNLVVVFIAPFFIVGLALINEVIYTLSARFGWSSQIKTLCFLTIYILMIATPLSLFVARLGLVENMVNFRKKLYNRLDKTDKQ